MKINLLPLDQRPLKQSKIRWEFIVSLLAFLLLIIIVWTGYTQRLNVQALEQEYQTLLSYRVILQRETSLVNALEDQERDLTKHYDHYQSLVDGSNLDFNALAKVIGSIPHGLWLESLQQSDFIVLIEGYTRDAMIISALIRNLNDLDYNTKLNQLNSISEGALTSFSIEAERR